MPFSYVATVAGVNYEYYEGTWDDLPDFDALKEYADSRNIAYKDVSEVVEVAHHAGISKKVARLRPLGVIKG